MLTYTGNECFGVYIAIIYLFMVENHQRGRFRASPPFPIKGKKIPDFETNPSQQSGFISVTDPAENRGGEKKKNPNFGSHGLKQIDTFIPRADFLDTDYWALLTVFAGQLICQLIYSPLRRDTVQRAWKHSCLFPGFPCPWKAAESLDCPPRQ